MTASDIGKCGKHPLNTALELEAFFDIWLAGACLPISSSGWECSLSVLSNKP
jgi:hypothetical protein